MGVCERCVWPCLAELFGTMLFVFVACLCVIDNTDGVTQPAVAQGLGLTALIFLLGNISGGHFNPAVSLSVYLSGQIELLLLLLYILAQVAGAMIGAALAKGIYPLVDYAASCGGAFSVVETSTDVCAAILAETIMTLFLCTVVCLLAIDNQSGSHMAPFCVGLTVTGCMLAGASVSGACMNPARAFGPAVAANHWTYHWIYWVGPCCGALLTPGFIGLLIGEQQTPLVLKRNQKSLNMEGQRSFQPVKMISSTV
ncbi:aquaporin-8-like [Genypterus blacodes]|uniref:aquaporin-8-like n=1 Tax=Genypterus blacodes TaxID=154954 RepID=UPI003F766A0A